MTATLPEVLTGCQEPTHRIVNPEVPDSHGHAAAVIADMVGLHLDEWEINALVDGMGYVEGVDAAGNPAERWAAGQVGLEVSRQNGKTVILAMRMLIGIFVLNEKVIVYSAHENETAKKTFEFVQQLIKSSPALHAKVKVTGRSSGFRTTNGQIAINFWTGQQIVFRTRTTGTARGLSADCLIVDEWQELSDTQNAALQPIVSAQPNPQTWFAGSAGTRKSTHMGRFIRKAAERVRVVLHRWAADDTMDPDSPLTWARLNPAYGPPPLGRLHPDTVRDEHDAMPPDLFAQERLGVGDYPREDGADWVIPRPNFEAGIDQTSKIVGPIVISVEVKWDRQRASISVAGLRSDNRKHIGTIANEPGVMWTVQRIVAITKKNDYLAVVIDPNSPANVLVAPLEDAGVTVHLLKSVDLTRAFGSMYDAFNVDLAAGEKPRMVHTGGSVLTSSLAEASTRDSVGATTWRRATQSDGSAIQSACWAAEGLDILGRTSAPPPSPERADDGDDPDVGGSDVYSMGF